MLPGNDCPVPFPVAAAAMLAAAAADSASWTATHVWRRGQPVAAALRDAASCAGPQPSAAAAAAVAAAGIAGAALPAAAAGAARRSCGRGQA